MRDTTGKDALPPTGLGPTHPKGHFRAPSLTDVVAAPLLPVSLGSLEVSFQACFDLCSNVIRASNEIRQPCACVWKKQGPRQMTCRMCHAAPLDSFSSAINGPGFLATTHRLFHHTAPDVTLAMAISIFEEDWGYDKIFDLITTLDPTNPQASGDAALQAIDQPVHMLTSYQNRSVVRLGRISLTHNALYVSDAGASREHPHAIARVGGWSNRFVDGYLLFQHPSVIAGYPGDDCSVDWVSGIILLDSRLSDSFEQDVIVLSPEESPLHDQELQRAVSRRYQRQAASVATLLNAEVASLRSLRLVEKSILEEDEEKSDAAPANQKEQYLDALSWMVAVTDGPRRFGRRKKYGLISNVDSGTRAAMLWRLGLFDRSMRMFGRRPINLDAVRGKRPPAPLLSKNFCDACGGRKRLGYSLCNGCERDFSKSPREAYDYLPPKLRERILRQSAPEYFTKS